MIRENHQRLLLIRIISAYRKMYRTFGCNYNILGEKTSNFDYVFSTRNPRLSGGKVAIKLHFDLEPQRDYHLGYPIEKRAYYYRARMMFLQLSVIMEETDYGRFEKCCGTWICWDRVPQNKRYTVSLYEIANTHNIGRCAPIRDNYDLMTLVVIRLEERVYNGDDNDERYELFDFLNLMMYPHNKDFIKNMSKHKDGHDKLKRALEMLITAKPEVLV